ncbi:MAG TPA: hypothetical protein DHU72_03565 [Rikenellaceae bacterium]|nr:hypothetical protein [Rikenellaceae bacterium]
MKRYSSILLLCSLAFLMISCIKDVDLINDDPPTVVVECCLTNTKAEQALYLSYTKQKNQTDFKDISGAVVTLTDKTKGEVIGNFTYQAGDTWLLDYIPEAGHEYRLDIKTPSGESVWAECKMPTNFIKAHLIQTVGFVERVSAHLLSDYMAYCIHFVPDKSQNPSDLPERYWETNGYCYSIEEQETGEDVFFSLDIFQGYTNDYKVVSMDLTTDLPFLIGNNVMDVNYGEGVEFPIVKSLEPGDEETYLSYEPFPSEEEDHYTAYYYPSLIGAKVCKDSIVFRNNVKLQDKYFLISAYLGDVIPPYVTPDKCRLTCTYRSKDMYSYFKDVENLTSSPEKKDFTHIFVRDNILTNIKGGIGFFGAEYKEDLPWALMLSPMEKSDLTQLSYITDFYSIKFE